jgi:hypothetical protein
MGQAGYGVHQAYLWYMRDGPKLEHRIHLFAFISDDFNRMKSAHYAEYGKPFVTLEDGELAVKNTPVPAHSYAYHRVTERLRRLAQFRFFELAGLVGRHYGLNKPQYQLSDRDARDVAFKMFEELERVHRSRGTRLVLVHLPEREDREGYQSDYWAGWLRSEVRARGIEVVELIDDFRRLPPAEARAWFRGRHYSDYGNRRVAELLYQRIKPLIP